MSLQRVGTPTCWQIGAAIPGGGTTSRAAPGSAAAWPTATHPSECGTHVFVGGLSLHATEKDVVGLFADEPPNHCYLEPLHGENWQDGAQTGRRRYGVVSWDGAPRSDMLTRVAETATIGGKQAVVVAL